ncbi:hypothetical protein BN1012_Phect564 [Candidatus Phaeomarinobacter ectocarpi]|uniref:Uncharacterized protein n=1 Tax=Candidatus Phaeomarinibacter ectocarpi TaxID=1458461 RepID=X5M6T8_9HYPH|nr:hypothetical protein [Candidatus Phaeomarinobacter ectocarpi]CDO58778.1 hypothetical protein BN1012_Phect564 [Candidatus Phaeomarinobacter ectocarpi]
MSLCSKGATHTSIIASVAIIGGLALGGAAYAASPDGDEGASGKHEFASPETIASIWGDDEAETDATDDATETLPDVGEPGAQGDVDPETYDDPHSSSGEAEGLDDDRSDDDVLLNDDTRLE